MKGWLITAVLFSLSATFTWAQTAAPPREINAVRLTKGNIQVDGDLKEEAWKTATILEDFIEFKPSNGEPESPQSKLTGYLLFDNTAIYVGGYCRNSRDSISTELVGRDRIGSNDFVAIFFDTYHDKINGLGFFVTPLGEQFDARYAARNEDGNEEDPSWNAVWTSETKMQVDGWTFEMRIPYAAIRFSTKNSNWGINMMRRNLKNGKEYFWNPVNNQINGFVNQWGIIRGMTDIQPPLRLSLSPYFSSYLNHYPYNVAGVKNITTSINGGADLKYGINQNFTLDMTLIPDFGQVASDKLVLNLTPFEVQYNENRPFFIEGTDLFSKGGLFYSRRVGAAPVNKDKITDQLQHHEEIVESPTQSKLVNAIKVSGRTRQGTGLGFFNAITRPMYAEVLDRSTGQRRKIETGPLTNYNIMVVDQSLKNNSSVSFINTNTMRSGGTYDANVNAALYNLNLNKNTYNINGNHSLSTIVMGSSASNGYSHAISAGKVGGLFNFQLQQRLADDKYDKNDLGILNNNNYLDHSLWLGYKLLKPRSFYQNLYFNFNTVLSHRFTDKRFQRLLFNTNINGKLKNLWQASWYVSYSPEQNDFYEPRAAGRGFKRSSEFETGFSVDGNPAKRYMPEFYIYYSSYSLFDNREIAAGYEQRYRFNDRLSVETEFNYSLANNQAGYAAFDASRNVIFGRRSRQTSENSLEFKYNFNKRMGMEMEARHYWSQVNVKQFYLLEQNGYLSDKTTYTGNHNINLNLFNIDWVYFWEFRPGSFLNVVWKNAIYDENKNASQHYFKNLDYTLQAKQNNNLSVKFLYYFDYQDLVQRRKKRQMPAIEK